MPFIIPDAAIGQHVIVLGKTRSGKSSTIRLMVEWLLDAGKPVCILDPKGDWWGLKSSNDGKHAGYPVVIFGGDHADVPLDARAGAAVAELVATGNRPCVIDLGGWMVGERTRFFVDFASSLFKHTRGPRWLVIDECHNFAPQGRVLDPDSGKMLHWANRLASEGSGKGVTLISASQRPQKVHKDYVTSHETLIAMRVVHPLDRGAIKEWIDGCPDAAKGREVLTTLAGMKRGQGWVWSPEIGFGPTCIQFPMFKTYDSFKAPSGEAATKLKGWAAVDLDDVRSRLSEFVDEAKASDPKMLRAEIVRLKSDIQKLSVAKTDNNRHDPEAIAKAEERGFEQAKKKLAAAAEIELQTLRAALVQKFGDAIKPLMTILKDELSATQTKRNLAFGLPFTPSVLPTVRNIPAATSDRAVTAPTRKTIAGAGGNGTLPPGERAILVAAVQYQGVDRDQLSVLTGYKRSSRDAYIQRLREKGYIDASGQTISPTDTGATALGGDYEPLPTGADLQRYWQDRLPEGEGRILAVLVEAYPEYVDRNSLDEITGYKRSSRDAYLQRLKARRLVEIGASAARASDKLF